MVPVLLLTGMIAYLIKRGQDIRIQLAVLIVIGMMAFIFSMFSPNSSSGSFFGYLLLSPMTLWWAIAIFLPFFIIRHFFGPVMDWTEPILCTLFISVIFLVIAIIVLILDLMVQSVMYDPLLVLQFLLPTPGPGSPEEIPSSIFQIFRFLIIVGLAVVSYLLIRLIRILRLKERRRRVD